LVAFFHSCH